MRYLSLGTRVVVLGIALYASTLGIPTTAAGSSGDDASQTPGLESRLGFHSYVNIGQAWGHQPGTGRVDETRYLALPAFGVDAYPAPRWRISLSGESLIGLIAPSIILRGTVDFHPFGSQSDGPFATLGARWVAVNAAIICSNDNPSCTDTADRARDIQDDKPADALGPTVTGLLGEVGLGYQSRINSFGLYALASYQGGYLTPTPNAASSEAPPLEAYYHGYLVTLGLRTF